MKKNYILILSLLLTAIAFANHGKDSTTVAKKTRSFKNLDAQLDANFFSLNNQSQKFTKEYMQNLVVRDSVINTQLSEAIGTMDVLEENGQANGGTYTVKNKSLGQGGVYEAQPVINLNNKEYVKINDDFIANNPNKTRVQVTTDINTQGFNTWKLVNAGGSLSTRVLNAVSDANLISIVKVLRQKLTSNYKKSGDFGHAELNISSVSKNEYYAHSGIQNLIGDLPNRVPDISLRPTQSQEIFPYSTQLNSAGVPNKRNVDTKYKILTGSANDIGENFNVTGTVKLFTERVPCSSCSNVINLFSSRYPNLTIEIIHNNDIILTNF